MLHFDYSFVWCLSVTPCLKHRRHVWFYFYRNKDQVTRGASDTKFSHKDKFSIGYKDEFAINLLALLIKFEAVLEKKIKVPQKK